MLYALRFRWSADYVWLALSMAYKVHIDTLPWRYDQIIALHAYDSYVLRTRGTRISYGLVMELWT